MACLDKLKEKIFVHVQMTHGSNFLQVSLEDTRIKEDGKVIYAINENKSEIIITLFNDFISIVIEDQFIDQLLPHVYPMINLDTFTTARTLVDRFVSNYQEKLLDISNISTITIPNRKNDLSKSIRNGDD
ncbi:hypothetical protein [Metabacillus malikii]|uniref:Uncharacterized protein n=1 Tax=Metabacillus malikii TaxID=1504265 RepID=A0ABT9ZLT2_9BACI|nr:hypothetical protein [Metabacillus malikii]MDQ0232864.1 hypothetical protein [Metabacillus malikii]